VIFTKIHILVFPLHTCLLFSLTMPTTGYNNVEWGPLQIRFSACLNTLKTEISLGYRVQINY